MALIDGKGRLFGKINIVDFFVITLLLVVTPAFFYIYSVSGKRPISIPSHWIKAEAVTFVMPEAAKLLEAGQAAFDKFGDPIGKLVRVYEKDAKYADRIKKATINTAQHPEHEYTKPVFLELELLCTKSAEGEPWYYARHQLYAGEPYGHIFDTERYLIYFYVLKIED